jgi:hypothetical protein
VLGLEGEEWSPSCAEVRMSCLITVGMSDVAGSGQGQLPASRLCS